MQSSPAYAQLLQHLSRGGFGYYWIKHLDGRKETIWFDGEIPDLPEGQYDAYFGVNPARARRGGAARARNEDLAALNCVYAEFDAKDYQQGKDDILQLIAKLQLKPSVIIDSGGGYHCYWLFHDPRPLFDLKERAYLTDIQARWVDYVGADPDAKDLARVLRIPGTYNNKYEPAREVTFLRCSMDLTYYLEDLTALLPKPQPVVTPPLPSSQPNRSGNLDRWLQLAIARGPQGRNDTGFWLATQLRDDGISQAEAESVLRNYQAQMADIRKPTYTLKEALDSLKSAYKSPPRDPAKNLNRPAPAPKLNGNGHHPTSLDDLTPPEDPPMPEDWTTAPPATAPTAQPSEAGQPQPKPQEGDVAGLPELVYLDTAVIRAALDMQETGDADLMTRLFAGQIVYDHSASQWYQWKGSYWEQDKTGYVYHLISRRVAPQYLRAAAELGAGGLDKISEEMVKRAAALRNKKRMDNVLYLAARHPEIALSGEEWDADPWVLGCPNGVIDLRTGDLRQGRPKDFIRAHTTTEWKGLLERCPRWVQFMREVMGDDIQLVCYLQRLFGYGITGLRVEHIFPIFWGAEGRNGKGTMLETLAAVLGKDVASPTDAEALMASNKNGNAAQPFLHDLRGMRLVWASETDRGARVDMSLVKRLTGGDTIKARTLYSKPVEFKATHLLLLLTNDRPHINASDPAIWERVKLIEFNQRFVDNPQGPNEHVKDLYLHEKLMQEASGILAWLVNGCMEWQEIGLHQPDQVVTATAQYREEEDITGLFIAERCEVDPNEHMKASQLYTAYASWCKESGFAAMSLTSFGQDMQKKFKKGRTNLGFVYYGVGLKDLIKPQKEIPF
jgi:putative DNA primase/helicase